RASARERAEVEAFIASLPGVRRDGPKAFAYTDKSGRMFMSIYTDDAPKVEAVSVSVPAAFSGTSGEAALLLCFKIADHLGWGVFDEQLGNFLDAETPQQVLATHRKRGVTEEDILQGRPSSFWLTFLGEELSNHNKITFIITFVLATAITVL